MNGVKFILSVGICLGTAAVVAAGCSSSSGGPSPAADGGPSADARALDSSAEGAAGQSCMPFFLQLCPQGQTCCYSGLSGTCTDVGACRSPFEIGCVNGDSCGGGVCCGAVQLPAGFDASAFAADASFDASAFDASDFDASGFGFQLVCASSCAATQFQVCMTSKDCPSGDVCSGGPMQGAFGGLLICVPADAGAESGPSPDGGPAEAGPGAGDGG
jgi:hypothetical protein